MLVVFATPSYGKTPCIEFVRSALQTQSMMIMNSIPHIWADLPGDPYVHKARSRLASQFLTDYPAATDLFFIDDDVGWPPEAVARFIFRSEDVVCGVYPKKSDNPDFPVEMLVKDGKYIIERDGLYLAGLAATGFMRIKRHVLERLAEESGEYTQLTPSGQSIRCWDLFRTGWIADSPGSKTGRWWGEDYFFCIGCQVMGFSVWIDPSIEFTHTGAKSWRASFDDTLQTWVREANLEVRHA